MMPGCIGLYCGRTEDQYGNYSACGACSSGFRVDENSLCKKCDGAPLFYDWMYLCFMAIVSLGLNWFFIDFTNKRKSSQLLILHGSALLEALVSGVCALLVVNPVGNLDITSCPVTQLSDWYTLVYNPTPDYVTVIHCTQEAVYPLYTLVFIYYAFSLASMVLLRPFLAAKFIPRRGTKSIYAALFFYPALICLHAVLAGLIYYSYPYILLTVSVITIAIHLSLFKEQSTLELLKAHVKDVRNIIILLCHWALHAFGIISLTQLEYPKFHLPLLCLIPLPALIYIFTVKFTDPSKLDSV